VFVLVCGFPASGQETTIAEDTAAPEAQEPVTPTRRNGNIGFASASESRSGIFEMSPVGTGVTPVGGNNEGISPNWSSDGRMITFVSPERDIYVMNADGSNRKRLTAPSDYDYDPALSPDGTKIAFVRDLPIRQGEVLPKIFVMNVDGTNMVQIRTDTTSSESYPAWSPDGSKIVFVGVGVIAGSEEIYTMNVDGTDITQLTDDSTFTKESPDWSPDGSKIVFGAYDRNTGGKYDIFAMNADGSGVENLTNQADVHDIQPVWSPDGREIAFVRDPDLDTFGDSEIWRMRADGSSPTNITSNAVDDSSPDWLPQGAGIPLTGDNGVDTGSGQGNGAGANDSGSVDDASGVINGRTSNRQLPNTGGAAIFAPVIGLLLISGAVARLVVRRR
jgi:TolB protein